MQYSGEFPGNFCGLASVPGRGAEGTDILKATQHDQKEMFLNCVCPLHFRDAPTKKATVVPQGVQSIWQFQPFCFLYFNDQWNIIFTTLEIWILRKYGNFGNMEILIHIEISFNNCRPGKIFSI